MRGRAVISREVAEMVSGRPIGIDDRLSANGFLGAQLVMNPPPEGYMLGVGIRDSLVAAPLLPKIPKCETRTDLSLFLQVHESVAILIAGVDTGAKSMKDLLQLSAQEPGSIAYASWRPGPTPHLVVAAVEMQSNVKFTNVSYRGLTPATAGFYGKQNVPLSQVQQLATGVGVAVRVVDPAWAIAFSQIPTLQERGSKAPILEANVWIGIFGPKGLPQPIVDRWVTELGTAIRSPEFANCLTICGMMLPASLPIEFQAIVAETVKSTVLLIHDVSLQPE